MSKKITMEYLAKKLGISKNTISLALRNMPGISEETRKAVLEEAKKYGYQYKKAGAALDNTPKLNNICLILASNTKNSFEFFSHIQIGIESSAKQHGYNVILTYYDDKHKIFETPICIRDRMVCGIITLGNIDPAAASLINNYNLPVVMVDNYFYSISSECVLTDNHLGGYLATQNLIANGHRNIAYLGNIDNSVSFYDRFQGYLNALKANKISHNDTYFWNNISIADLLRDSKYDLAVSYIKKNTAVMPTAFFCCNDSEALSLIKVLSALGIKVPEQISVIGFDDIDASQSSFPPLSTMHVSKEIMGERAVEKLISKTEVSLLLPNEKTLIAPYLVIRNSVKNL
jgi:DNA-binding LacI/PurR family transcriptional regulator